jgi:hypothetical protein
LLPDRTHAPAHAPHSSRSGQPLRSLSLRLRLTLGGTALGLLALAGGFVGPWAAAPAHQATAASAAPAGTQSGRASRSLALDAFASHASAPQASGGGGTGGSGKAAARHRATARAIARRMLRRFRWSPRRQFRYLNKLWDRESGWNVYAENPYSAAYGIPQAVPGSKMSSAGPNWQSNARTQIRWGLRYIRSRYGSPRRAWEHEVSAGWY